MNFLYKKNQGFSLLEVVFVIFILAISIIALYSLFNMALKMIWENKARTGASQLANQKLELARNLPYDDVGTVSGVPPGAIPQLETISLNGIEYTVRTTINYADDPFDGTSGGMPNDTLGNDYKKVKVEIGWQSEFSNTPVEFYTDVVPKGIETNIGGGTLFLSVFDMSGLPVANANIRIINTSTAIDVSQVSSAQGELALPGMPADNNSYSIIVNKADYSKDSTYNITLDLPSPDPGHLSVFEGQVTSKSFIIDKLARFRLTVKDPGGIAIANLPVHIYSDKTIGADSEGDPVYKFDKIENTDGNGLVDLGYIEWDTYTIEISNTTGWDISSTDPIQPVLFMPLDDKNISIEISPTTVHSLLAIIRDENDIPIDSAIVHVTNGSGYDNTIITGSAGQAFFTSLDNSNTTVAVSKSGYKNYSNELLLSGYVVEPVTLVP